MRARRTVPVAALAVALGTTAAAARAQAAPDSARRLTQALATNPILWVGGLFTADYERAVGAHGFTVGAAGWLETDEPDARWLQARALYYPNEVALKGFGIGLTAGVHRQYRTSDASDLDYTYTAPDGRQLARRPYDTAPTLGVTAQYNWLLGRRRQLLVGIGVGAKRALATIAPDSPMERVLGDGRFVIGWAF